jgi:hypothetical protein
MSRLTAGKNPEVKALALAAALWTCRIRRVGVSVCGWVGVG